MATTTRLPIEVYLRTSDYEPDAEFVDGEIEERPMGEYDHADWQQAIQRWFAEHAKEWNIRVISELRVRVSETRCRVPDVTVLDRSKPREQVISTPPIAVFEVFSPEDRIGKIMRKFADCEEMGIPQIWLVYPKDGSTFRFRNGALSLESQFKQGAIEFPLAAIAERLMN